MNLFMLKMYESDASDVLVPHACKSVPPQIRDPCRCPHLRAFHKNVLLVQLQLVDEVIIGRIVNKTAAAVRDNEVVAAGRADREDRNGMYVSQLSHLEP